MYAVRSLQNKCILYLILYIGQGVCSQEVTKQMYEKLKILYTIMCKQSGGYKKCMKFDYTI